MKEFDIKKMITKAHLDNVGMPFPVLQDEKKNLFVLPNLKNIGVELRNGSSTYFMQIKLSYNGEKFMLPNEPLVSISLEKTIIETATVSRLRKGTVKEYINTGDYEISFRGVCYDEDDMESYPSDQVSMINKLFEIEDALDVEDNKFFELFNIRRIVLKDIQFDEMEGEQGLQRYKISAVSDQDFYADLSERGLAKLMRTS